MTHSIDELTAKMAKLEIRVAKDLGGRRTSDKEGE